MSKKPTVSSPGITMIRLLFFFTALILLAVAASWFVSHDGLMEMEWLGYHIDMNVSMAIGASALIIIVLLGVFETVLWLRSLPKRLAFYQQEKRTRAGLKFLTEGFASMLIGDVEEARKLSRRAAYLLPELPLTTLLSAQIAQIENSVPKAREEFGKLLEFKETELVAMRGLILQARKDGDWEMALNLARRAVAKFPDAKWGHRTLVDIYKQCGLWDEAQLALEMAVRKRAIEPDESKRLNGVLYLVRSLAAQKEGNLGDAMLYAGEAYKNATELVPVVGQYAKMFLLHENPAKAAEAIERQWKKMPHPDLSTLYLEIFDREPPEKRLRRAEKLANVYAEHQESQLIVGKAALLAGDYAKARSHLKMALSQGETSRACQLMAELEEREGNETLALQWRERAKNTLHDHHWVCHDCGHNTSTWHVHCESCHHFDTLDWHSENPVHIIRAEERVALV
jgi:HemY protein